MTSFIGGVPKEVRRIINWIKANNGGGCAHCQKAINQFKFLWLNPYLNVLCGCPGYHYAILMKCDNCGMFKDMALGKNGRMDSICPKCLV